MPQSDRLIPESARCPHCEGAGWKWWSAEVTGEAEGKWVVCRECLGTGRSDQKGRKRQKPAEAPA